MLIEQFAPVALGLANRAYIMEGGLLRFCGQASELRAKPELLRSAYLLRGSDALPGGPPAAPPPGGTGRSGRTGGTGRRGRATHPGRPARARRPGIATPGGADGQTNRAWLTGSPCSLQ